MLIDLSQLDSDSEKFSCVFSPQDVNLDEEDGRLSGSLKIEGTAKKTGAGYEVKGALDCEVELDCTRCLQPKPERLAFEFTAAYVSAEEFDNSVETELKDDDLDVSVYEDDKIDFAELAREQVLLNVPSRTLCKEDCKGLCATCGAKKNIEACDCDKNEVDPRWEALKNFKK